MEPRFRREPSASACGKVGRKETLDEN
jgi:hypothetical protein